MASFLGGFLGAIVGGMVIGGPLGALVGAIAGSFLAGDLLEGETKRIGGNSGGYSSGGSKGSAYENSDYADRYYFQLSVLALMAAVMKADGKVVKSELDKVKEWISVAFPTLDDQRQALQILKAILQKKIDVDGIATQVRMLLDIYKRRELVRFLVGIGYADGDFSTEEDRLIAHICSLMGISARDYTSIKAAYSHEYENSTHSSYRGGNGYGGYSQNSSQNKSEATGGYGRGTDWAYTTLQIDRTATNDEVKKAYRKMAMKYHPDRVSTLGESVVNDANKLFERINEAYSVIKKERGMA